MLFHWFRVHCPYECSISNLVTDFFHNAPCVPIGRSRPRCIPRARSPHRSGTAALVSGHYPPLLAARADALDSHISLEYVILSSTSWLRRTNLHLRPTHVPWSCLSIIVTTLAEHCNVSFSDLYTLLPIWYTVRCRYNAVEFFQTLHNMHLIARPLGRSMGCFLWVLTLTCDRFYFSHGCAVCKIILNWTAL